MSEQKIRGKVIRYFTVEVSASSDSAKDINLSNPYTLMSSEERLKDFIEIFGLLLEESYRKASSENPH